MNNKTVILSTLVGLGTTIFLFINSEKIASLYNQKGDMQLAFTVFLTRHEILSLSQIQSVNDEFIQNTIRAYLKASRKNLSEEKIKEIDGRGKYFDFIEDDMKDTGGLSASFDAITNEINSKENLNIYAFIILVFSQLFESGLFMVIQKIPPHFGKMWKRN